MMARKRCAELRKTRDEELMNDAELARSRAQIKASVLMSLESTSARAERLARHLTIFDRIIPVEEMAQRIDAVSADDIRRTAERILSSPPTVSQRVLRRFLAAWQTLAWERARGRAHCSTTCWSRKPNIREW